MRTKRMYAVDLKSRDVPLIVEGRDAAARLMILSLEGTGCSLSAFDRSAVGRWVELDVGDDPLLVWACRLEPVSPGSQKHSVVFTSWGIRPVDVEIT